MGLFNPYRVAATAAYRWQRLKRFLARDDGYSSEAVATTALLVALALSVIGILVAKVVARANSIDLNP
jgi:uncharacterized membrane protein YidH (DUF202 family)